MNTLRELMQDILRQFSTNNQPKSEDSTPSHETFLRKYLSGEEKKPHPEILCGKSCYDLPVKAIAPLSREIVSAYTGPNGGLTQVNQGSHAFGSKDIDVDFIDEDIDDISKADDAFPEDETKWIEKLKNCIMSSNDEIAGIKNWNNPTPNAYGIATTLYECHPITKEKAGEPVADSFGICVRKNNAILALADGVNWGEKACLAARCAIHGCIDYLNKALFKEGSIIETTMDVFVCLLRSFHAAHSLIIQENGLLTTLCVAVVCQLKNSTDYIACTCNVGDSLAFVFSEEYGVWEITQGSHDIFAMRDMRDALGALGPVDGLNPELSNLTVAMTIVKPNDIVFLTSDGISDNFDPVVGKFAVPKKKVIVKTPIDGPEGVKRSNSKEDGFDFSLPTVEAKQRHELTLLRMEDLLVHGVQEGDKPCKNSQELCELLLDFAFKLTMAKRRILEDPDLFNEDDEDSQAEQRMRRRKVGEKLARVPGKLDHASIVAYMVPS